MLNWMGSSRAYNSYRRFMRVQLLLLGMVGLPFLVSGQPQWTGTWSTQYKPWPHIPAIHMLLHIAEPTADMLYPAKLELTHGSFRGTYELLLVKKNEHQLGIGRNKYPLVEEPFGLGPWMMYLNGVWEYQQDGASRALVLKRLWLDNFGIFMKGLYDNEFYTNTKVYLRDFLYRADIELRQVDSEPWVHPSTQRIIHTDTIYYGVYEPIESKEKELSLTIQDEERYDRDTVTIVHNGKLLANRLPLEKAMGVDSIVLDSGANYIALFADNYGDLPPNTANFIMGTDGEDGQLYGFDFTDPANVHSTVMVAHFQYQPTTDPRPQVAERANPTYAKGRRDQRIGNLRTYTERVELEIRDEQVEDGDVISLEVNGAMIANQVEVTKQGKRFGITLKTGRNRIVFQAENLGRIPPNTAVLLVYADGEQRKFQLSTDFERNNVLDVFFQH